MPLPELSGSLGSRRAAHLLRRATFGPTKADIDSYASKTPAAAINLLFNSVLSDPALPIDPLTGNDWIESPALSEENDLQEYFKGWFIGQMMSTGIPAGQSLAYSAREKIVMFLHTHFTAIQSKINSAKSLYFQNQLYRLYAFDGAGAADVNFKGLTTKVSVGNAMIRLLDGNENVKGSPNENYARELLELYSIGRGLEGSLPPTTEQGDYILYKELDVQQAARVLSGFDFDESFSNLDPDTNLPRSVVRGDPNNASSHDNTAKHFSDHFGNTVIQADPLLLSGPNPTEASALDEISQLIEMIYNQPATARNICRKIYRFFVYHEITPVIDNEVISVMADFFISGGYKIQPVIENLLRSEHFYEAGGVVTDDNFGGIIKSPLDLMIGTLRFFEFPLPDPATTPVDFYSQTAMILNSTGGMGMSFYEPYDVSGYDAYCQYPIYNRSWISVNYLTERYAFIQGLINIQDNQPIRVDIVDFVRNTFDAGTASNARQLIMALASYLLPSAQNLTFDTSADDMSGLTAARMNYFFQAFLLTPQLDADPEAAWTTRWNTFADPETTKHQLVNLVNALLQSPEYQLF